MKVLFLDIDGVLNTHKTRLLHGNVFINSVGVKDKLDPYGSLFIKRLTQHGIQIVLSSAWRGGKRFAEEKERAFSFPIIDRTPSHPFPGSIRGDEIKVWLDKHPEVTHYYIVDDDPDMLQEQLPNFVQTKHQEGITFEAMGKICKILGFDVWDLTKYRKEPENIEDPDDLVNPRGLKL